MWVRMSKDVCVCVARTESRTVGEGWNIEDQGGVVHVCFHSFGEGAATRRARKVLPRATIAVSGQGH